MFSDIKVRYDNNISLYSDKVSMIINYHSVIADGVLQLAFAAITGKFQSITALQSIHI